MRFPNLTSYGVYWWNLEKNEQVSYFTASSLVLHGLPVQKWPVDGFRRYQPAWISTKGGRSENQYLLKIRPELPNSRKRMISLDKIFRPNLPQGHLKLVLKHCNQTSTQQLQSY